MQRTSFDLGETRYVRLQIKAINNQIFKINTASYKLITEAGAIETTGDCEIVDHMILALISPTNTGRYKVVISYEIGNEVLIEVVEVVVA